MQSFKSCPTLCNPMDYSPPGSSVHEILQARILEWVAIFFSRGSCQPRDQTRVSCIAGGFFTIEPPGHLRQRHSDKSETKTVHYHLYEESKKCNILVNIIKKKQTHRYREQTSGYQWGEGRGRDKKRLLTRLCESCVWCFWKL